MKTRMLKKFRDIASMDISVIKCGDRYEVEKLISRNSYGSSAWAVKSFDSLEEATFYSNKLCRASVLVMLIKERQRQIKRSIRIKAISMVFAMCVLFLTFSGTMDAAIGALPSWMQLVILVASVATSIYLITDIVKEVRKWHKKK